MKQVKDDIYWRKARLAARIILRSRAGRLTPRDRRIGAWLKTDPGVTDRLIYQAINFLTAPKLFPQSSYVVR
jgi:hypothetical protein